MMSQLNGTDTAACMLVHLNTPASLFYSRSLVFNGTYSTNRLYVPQQYAWYQVWPAGDKTNMQ